LRFQQQKRAGRPLRVQPEYVEVGDDRVIGSTAWTDESGARQERYQVLTFRDGKIVDIQGCSSRREAERFAARRPR
jgi:hypothetical protein